MATLDDKLLGEKLQYYYSSSDEDDHDEGTTKDCSEDCGAGPCPEGGDFSSGSAVRTGPKGVIQDWRRFKQLETEKKREQADERMALAKKLSLSCRTYDEDLEEKEKEAIEEEFEGLDLEDAFMRQYREQRMREMAEKLIKNRPVFGSVVELTRDDYVEAIDKEKNTVLVVVHVYGNSIPGCLSLDGCIQCLAQEYPNVKFCRAAATAIQVSNSFCEKGLPALLVYRGGQLIGNFIRVTDQLGEDFFAVEVEAFLQDHGLLPNKEEQKTISGGVPRENNQSEDSDLDLD